MMVAPGRGLESLSSKYCCCSLYFLFSAFFFLRPRYNNTYNSTVSDAHAASPLTVFCWLLQGVDDVGIALRKRTIYSTMYITKIKIHSSCEIEDFVETHLCKLCVILRSRAI